MVDERFQSRLRQYVADMVALESQIEEAFKWWVKEASAHPEAAEAVKGFHATVKGHGAALQARLRSIGGEPGAARTIATTPAGIAGYVSVEGGKRPVSTALHDIYTALTHAALGYSMLKTRANRFYDSGGEANTADLAEKHLRDYAEAAQAIHQLIADVVVWELDQDGLECQCHCPSCGMGLCICVPSNTTVLNTAWRETAPADQEDGVLVWTPRANSSAVHAGIRAGDIIVAVDSQKVRTYGDLHDALQKREPGEEVRFRVLRGTDEPLEITATRTDVGHWG